MKRKCFVFLFVLICSFDIVNGMDVYLGIQTKGSRMDLGVGEFVPKDKTPEQAASANQIRDIVLNDLLFGLYFNVQETEQPLFSEADKIDFKPWKDMQTDVLTYAAVNTKSGFITLTVRAYDVESQQMIWLKDYHESQRDIRKLAHMISDEIVSKITGEKGIAQSRITFCNDGSGHKEVFVVDYDGYNPRQFTYNKSIALFPRWSPDGKQILFTSYHHGNPDLFMISSDGIISKPVSERQGLNTSGRWSPDGKSIVLTLSMGKSPDIYLIDVTGKIIKKLTSGWGGEVAPCFSPDGNSMVFTSDKPGYPQIYMLDVKTGTEKRLVSGNYADSPVWSPRGDSIAFSMMDETGHFEIFTVDVAGKNLVQLTRDAGKNENPSWSPDGRFLVFTSNREGKNELFIMAADGSRQKKLMNIKGECFTPDWSR